MCLSYEFYIVSNRGILLLLDNTIITFRNKKTGSESIERIILKLKLEIFVIIL